MAHVDQELDNGSMKVRFVRIEPDLLEMDVFYSGDSGMPPDHYHPSQAEHFTVVQGAMNTVIDGVQRTYSEGEEFDVPKAARHHMSPEGPTRVHWEVRPSLRTAEFFERIAGGQVDENFLEEFKNEIRFG